MTVRADWPLYDPYATHVAALRQIRSDVIDLGKRANATMNALEVGGHHAEAVQVGLVCSGLMLMVHRLSETIAAIGAES